MTTKQMKEFHEWHIANEPSTSLEFADMLAASGETAAYLELVKHERLAAWRFVEHLRGES